MKVIRKDLDGSEIRQTKGSLGFQVWLRGKFVSWQRDIAAANALLSKLQEKAETR